MRLLVLNLSLTQAVIIYWVRDRATDSSYSYFCRIIEQPTYLTTFLLYSLALFFRCYMIADEPSGREEGYLPKRAFGIIR